MGGLLLLLLSLLIHDGLYGWAGSFCTEQNHTAKPNFMLSIYHFDDSGPDRNKCYTSIETVKCLLLFVYTHNNNKTLWFGGKKKTNWVRSLSSPSPRIESLKCLLSNEVSLIENKHSVMK